MAEKNTVTLSKPITAHGDEIKLLRFREPTGADIMEFGYPIIAEVSGKGKVSMKVDANAAGELAAQLAGVPPSTVKSLPLSDFNAVVGVVAGFFMDSLKTLFSTLIST